MLRIRFGCGRFEYRFAYEENRITVLRIEEGFGAYERVGEAPR